MPLTNVERDIAKKVVTRFIRLKESTPYKGLVREFKDPSVFEHLTSSNILRGLGVNRREAFLPTALTFHYSSDVDALKLAKTSVTMILRVLHSLFYSEDDKEQFVAADVKERARQTDDLPPTAEELSLGLYLVPEFNVLTSYGYNEQQTDLISFRINDNIVTFDREKIENAWDEHIRQRTQYIDKDPETVLNAYEQVIRVIPNSRNIFVVHGHDEAAKQSVARFLEKLGLNPIILHEQPNKGRTIIEKFEEHSDVGFAVVLLTPDDMGGVSTDRLNRRARQNVILELGYFIGKLGRARVCALFMEGVEMPSDIHGVLYLPYDANGGWHLKLAKEIREAGIEVDLNRV